MRAEITATRPTLDYATPALTPNTLSTRVGAIDALRGMDMFCIISLESLLEAIDRWRKTHVYARYLDHAPWAGLHFYDVIFPVFVFVMGVSLVYSLSKVRDGAGRGPATLKIIRRALILYVLGLLFYGGVRDGWQHIRLMGVLQRLAICYLFAATALVWLRTRTIAWICAATLIAYWLFICYVPVPGIGAGHLEEGKNWANYIDQKYLPLRKWDGDHDPEGLLSSIPAVTTCLMGLFAGVLLRNGKMAPQRKATLLIGAGVAAIALGLLWHIPFPIIKKIWTSSFVLVTAGIGSILLGSLYWLIDIKGYKAWATPFYWFGANAITIFLVGNVLKFGDISKRLTGGPVSEALDKHYGAGFGGLITTLVTLGLILLFLRFLYNRKIFLRI